MKHIASVSFGKDSLAMLLRLIDEQKPLDEVVFYDTGMEFNAIYNIRDKVKLLLAEKNIKFTELKPSCPFLYKMFEMPVNKGKPNEHNGYSWCGGRCRWGTTEKLKVLEKYCKGSIEYVGIAIDEPKRLKKERKGNKQFPLAEWGMTEKDCLQYCRDSGYHWNEDGVDLYNILDRVSCWCCGNKNLKELKNYYLYLPKYWQRLKDLQLKTNRPFKNNKYTIYDLEEKFKKKERRQKMTLNEKIKQARKEAGLTQQQVADKVGIAKEVYQRYEYGTRSPRFEKLKAIAEACGVDLEYYGADVKNLQKIVKNV